MKLRTLAAAVLFGLAALACGGGGGVGGMDDYTFDYSVDVTSPWTDMGLPIADAVVTLSDATTLSMQYSDSTADAQIEAWTSYFTDNGFTESFKQQNEDGAMTAIYEKDGKTYTLAVVDAHGLVIVNVSAA